MSKQITEVALDKIFPSPTNPRKYFNETKLNQLAASIGKVGVIQAVTLRERADKPDTYEIVCGERRCRASKIAAKQTIPADIRILTDDEVQELQFIENIEREDVHPMDEAITFHAMQSNKTRPWLLEDIAAKINKPVSYIIQRLQLNKLVESLQKQFWDEKFLIGHAILFSRLTAADQIECAKSVATGGYYGTVKQTQEYIERNIIRNLKDAPFKIDDDTLKVKCGAGACTNCFNRSGVNRLLFEDVKQLDRCFDKSCFAEKKAAWILREVTTILENKPEVALIQAHYSEKPPADIVKLAKEYKVDFLNDQSPSVSSHQYTGMVPVKVFCVNGYDAGQYKNMFKKVSATETAKKIAAGAATSVKEIDEAIGTIAQRLTRGEELDFEKVQEEIVKQLEENYPEGKLLNAPFKDNGNEKLFTRYIVFCSLHHHDHSKLFKLLKLTEDNSNYLIKNSEDLFLNLLRLDDITWHTFLKCLLLQDFGTTRTNVAHAQIIRTLANDLDIPVDEIISRQDLAKQKRKANADKRIAELTTKKKPCQ